MPRESLASRRTLFGTLAGVSAVTSAALLGACATGQATDVERIEIACEESPIRISFPTFPGKGECIKWQHYLYGAPFSERSQQHFRFERFEDGFVNIQYLEAGPQKIFPYLELDQELNVFFRQVRESAPSLTDRHQLQVEGREFEVARFELSDNRRCVGFLTRWLRTSEGWKHKIVGYACGSGVMLGDTRIVSILEGIEIAAVQPSDASLTTTSGAYAYESVFTSAVYETEHGPELADELEVVALDHGVIYLYVRWRGLSLSEHRADLSITDGAGREVHSTYVTFVARTDHWNNWFYYRFDPEKDRPGQWTFTVSLDGESALRKHLTVRQE